MSGFKILLVIAGMALLVGCPSAADDDTTGDDDTGDDDTGDDDTGDDDTGDDDAGDDDTGDDDTGDDDTGDDDTGDDDTGDDDDSTPAYTGEIDMDNAIKQASCTITVPQNPNGLDPEGSFDFAIQMEGWADSSWIELWDMTGPYCEGYDPVTGNPCDNNGDLRPGWDMTNINYGWNATDGFWDEWALTLPYHGAIWPPLAGASLFICEDAGSTFQTWFCGCDFATSNCFCSEFPLNQW